MADDIDTAKKNAPEPKDEATETADRDDRFTYKEGDLVLLNTKPEGVKTAAELEDGEDGERET